MTLAHPVRLGGVGYGAVPCGGGAQTTDSLLLDHAHGEIEVDGDYNSVQGVGDGVCKSCAEWRALCVLNDKWRTERVTDTVVKA